MSIEDDPFAYRITKSGLIIIIKGGEIVMEISGKKAARLIPKLGDNDAEDQQFLARATGNYRRGNEQKFKKQ